MGSYWNAREVKNENLYRCKAGFRKPGPAKHLNVANEYNFWSMFWGSHEFLRRLHCSLAAIGHIVACLTGNEGSASHLLVTGYEWIPTRSASTAGGPRPAHASQTRPTIGIVVTTRADGFVAIQGNAPSLHCSIRCDESCNARCSQWAPDCR